MKTRGSSNSGFGFMGMVLLILFTAFAGGLVVVLIQPADSARANHETVLKAQKLRNAITAYKMSHGGAAGSNPPALSDLVTDDTTPCAADNTPASSTYLTLQGWCGPYLDQEFLEDATDYQRDGWGENFQYNNGTNVLTSCGPNLSCGDGDDLTFNP